MEPLKIGLVGLGSRGYMLLKETLLYIPEMQISVVCDAYEDRIKQAQDLIEERCGHRPAAEPEYSEVLTRSDIDALIIATSWEHHVPAAIQAMKAGIPVGIESRRRIQSGRMLGACPDLRRDKNTVYVHGKLLLRAPGADGSEYERAGCIRRYRPLPRRLYA